MFIEVFDKATKEYIGVKNLHGSATEQEKWQAALKLAQLMGTKTLKRIRSVGEAMEALIMEVHN